MKIAFIRHGVERSEAMGIELYMPYLAKLGHDVTLICTNKRIKSDMEESGIRVLELPRTYSQWFRGLRSLSRELQPDIVHTSPQLGVGLYPRLLRTGGRPQFLLDVRTPILRTGIRKLIIRLKNRLESTGYDAYAAHMIESASSLIMRTKNVHWIPPGVDLNSIPYKSTFVENPGNLQLIYIGAIIPDRKPEVLIEAVSVASKQHPVTLDIYGPPSNGISHIIERYGAHGVVNFKGMLPRSELYQRLHQYDIGLGFVPKALYDSGPPLKTLEFLAAGLPTLATDTLGNRLYIQHKENGYLTGDDLESITTGLLTLFKSPELRRRLSARARESVVQYNWPTIVEQRLIPVYQSMIIQDS